MELAVDIPTGPAPGPRLAGDLSLPVQPKGIVVFAHGSGSSRLSPRNRHVAASLRAAGFATLLFDLLTEAEATDRANVFDIPLLAERVTAALDFLSRRPETAPLPLGLFGASTGAAAALAAAAARPEAVAAIVSRGGRPDLAGEALPQVRAPTLLIVGGADPQVLMLNRSAFAQLRPPKAFEIVPGATHLFEEPGTLDKVVALATAWFEAHLAGPS